MKDTSARIKWIDAIKGLGILFVLINHSCGFVTYGNILTACYMPLFFISAGFTLNTDNIRNNKYIIQRSKRLLIPWGIYGYAFVLLNLFTSVLEQTVEWKKVAINFGGMLYSRYCLYPLGTDNNIYFLMCFNNFTWFFTALFLAYLWVHFYFKAKQSIKIMLVFLYSILTVALSFCPILLPWSIDTSFMIALFIIIGYSLKKHGYMKLSCKSNVYILIGSFLLYVFAAYNNGNVNFSVRIYGDWGVGSILLFFIIGVLGTVFYSSLFKVLQKTGITSIIAYVGRHSITILCIHLFMFNTLRPIFKNRGNQYIQGTVMIIITIVVGTLLDNLYKYLSKRIKMLEYM